MRRIDTYWIAGFPVLLAIGIVTIPVVPDYANHGMAAEAAQQTGRWYWGHLITALAFGVGILAAVAFRSRMLAATAGRVGKGALPLIAIGATLHVVGLGADGIAPVASIASGGSPEAYFDGSGIRLAGVFAAGAATFVVGWISLFVEAGRVGLLRGATRWLVIVGALLFGAAEAIPSGWGLYIVAITGLCVWLPITVLAAREPAP